jgi:hypothetical protein
MNMKTSIIGPAEREQKDVQVKIDIIIKSINKYKRMLDYPHLNEESLIHIREKIDIEEMNLKKLKNKYPEYFI